MLTEYLISNGSWLSTMSCVGLLTIVLCNTSNRIQYYVKMSLFGVGSFLMATLMPLPLFIVRPRHHKNALGPAWGCRQLLRLLGLTFEVRGEQNIRRNRGAVVLINHQSFLDLGVLAALWPRIGRATVVAKRILLFIFPPAYGWGTLFIDRNNRADAVGKMNTQATAISQDAAKLLIFPEGTRHSNAQLLPFKKGPFHIAISAQSPLQPIVVSRYSFLGAGKQIQFRRGHAIISILPEIECKGLQKSDIDELIQRTRKVMQDEFDRLNVEASKINAELMY